MKILITGANGFLGAHLAGTLQSEAEVTGLIRCGARCEGTPFVSFAGLSDPVIEKAVAESDIIIHAAAQLHGSWDEMYQANVEYTQVLAGLAKKHALKKFIYISTENITQGNTDIYSRTKQLGEEAAAKAPALLVIRPTIIYGPGDTKYVGRLASIIRRYPVVPMIGSGRQKFQFVYIEDVAEVVRHAIERNIAGTCTIAGPESLSYSTFLRDLMEAMSVNKPVLKIPVWVLKPVAHVLNSTFKKPPLTPTQLDNLRKDRVYDMTATARLFGYSPTPLREGLRKSISL